MTSYPSVSIIGCGWLGLPLAEILVQDGYRVKGSTTTLEKIPALKKAGIFCFLATLEKVANNSQQAMAPPEGSLTAVGSCVLKCDNIKDLFDADIVIITLPFRRSFEDPRDYQKQIVAVLSECKKGSLVLFTSSTSVYPDNIREASEDLDLVPDNARSLVLRGIEKDILKNKGVVIRFAGLYGGTRKIGAFWAGKKELSGGDSPVNLIHQDDAVGIIKRIIEQREKVAGEIFNGCSDVHPTKKELYTAAAKKMNLAIPQFVEEKSGVKKIVVNEKVKKILGYRFLHPDPIMDIDAGGGA